MVRMSISFNPDNQLSDEELDKLAEKDFDAFLDYLDQKSEYLRKYTKPLDEYHVKRFMSMDNAINGKDITNDTVKTAKKIAKDLNK